MTEDEAHLKTCCGPEGAGRFNDKPWPARWCVGSLCSAWRWTSENRVLAISQSTGNAVEMDRSAAERAGRRVQTELADQGFCGLAGAPQ